MGTTLSGCIIIDDMLWNYNVGDSRVYLITKSSARQLTVDHSYVQALLDDGKITKEEAENHPNRNVILRALGVAKDVECDVVNMPLEEGYYLICSDGMSNYFDEKKFVKLISSKKTIADKVEDLVVFANSKGGSDNISRARALIL
jgi:protein phosphatase